MMINNLIYNNLPSKALICNALIFFCIHFLLTLLTDWIIILLNKRWANSVRVALLISTSILPTSTSTTRATATCQGWCWNRSSDGHKDASSIPRNGFASMFRAWSRRPEPSSPRKSTAACKTSSSSRMRPMGSTQSSSPSHGMRAM